MPKREALAVFEKPPNGTQSAVWRTILGIFQKRKRAVAYVERSGGIMVSADWRTGVEALRQRVFERDGYRCVRCPQSVTWDTGHMHERVHRGRGGDRTLDNCETLCPKCHIGPRGEHP